MKRIRFGDGPHVIMVLVTAIVLVASMAIWGHCASNISVGSATNIQFSGTAFDHTTVDSTQSFLRARQEADVVWGGASLSVNPSELRMDATGASVGYLDYRGSMTVGTQAGEAQAWGSGFQGRSIAVESGPGGVAVSQADGHFFWDDIAQGCGPGTDCYAERTTLNIRGPSADIQVTRFNVEVPEAPGEPWWDDGLCAPGNEDEPDSLVPWWRQ